MIVGQNIMYFFFLNLSLFICSLEKKSSSSVDFVSRNIVDINLVVLLRYVANDQVVEVSYLQTWTGQTTLLPNFMLFQPKLYLNLQQLLDWIFVG